MTEKNIEVRDYISKVVARSSLIREKFVESKTPSSMNNLVVVPFFGDIRSEFIFSTMILNKWKELNKFSYLVVCSWPGHNTLYPYADEYWTLHDATMLSNLVRGMNGLANSNVSFLEKILLRYLDNPQLMLPDDAQITRLYNNGISVQYLRESSAVLFTLPLIQSAAISTTRMLLGDKKKLLIMPTLNIHTWRNRKQTTLSTSKDFWLNLINKLSSQYEIIVYENYCTHELGYKNTISDWNIMSLLSAMRNVDCVLDIFNQVSKYAYMARAPVFILDERQRYFGVRDYELDDLCGSYAAFRQYAFSFSPIINGDQDFIADIVLSKLPDFLNKLQTLPSLSPDELSINLSYASVRKHDAKKFGVRHIIMPKIDDDED